MHCPGCTRFYCRECVSEHEGRYLCTTCLKNATGDTSTVQKARTFIRPLLKLSFAMLLLFAFFSILGDGLSKLPTLFFEDYKGPMAYEETDGGSQ